jgi:hypothetical protein
MSPNTKLEKSEKLSRKPGWLRSRIRSLLLLVGGLGPLALLLADRLGHLFGICIGGH